MRDPEVRSEMASAWMKRGIALLNENSAASLTQALRWFERAIELRRGLPLQENPWYRYVLAAGWMNRGDALTRLGSEKNLAEAGRSYDEALAVLRTLDLASNPLFRHRLAVAWANRGITLQAQATEAALVRARESFEEAIALLLDYQTGETKPILASAWLNRGNVLLRLRHPQAQLALESAKAALALVVDAEEEQLLAAETALKARHVICQAIVFQLAGGDSEIEREDLIAIATDAVDDGMRMARRWEAQRESCFRELARRLFHFGALVYQQHQTHFLTEFLLENLDPARSRDAFPVDDRMHAAAGDAISRAFHEIQRDSFGALRTPRFDRLLKTLRQLQFAEGRLEEVRLAKGCGPALSVA